MCLWHPVPLRMASDPLWCRWRGEWSLPLQLGWVRSESALALAKPQEAPDHLLRERNAAGVL